MNTIDFSKCRHIEEFASTIKETFPKYTKKERKRFAYEIMNNTKKRVFTYEEFNLIVKDSQERKHLESKQSGKDKDEFRFSRYDYDEARLSYSQFLNRDDQDPPKDFQDMTEDEWVKYFVNHYKYPKITAQKCGRSMYHYLRENILVYTKESTDEMKTHKEYKYPLHPLLEDK